MKKAVGIIEEADTKQLTKPMSAMEPLEVCVVCSGKYKGHIVMRTAYSEHFEVMFLSDLRQDVCWTDPLDHKVTPYIGDTITLKLK